MFLSVILSKAKDLMLIASGDEVLRFTQDDKNPTLRYLYRADDGPR
jgi:hypothetical protein